MYEPTRSNKLTDASTASQCISKVRPPQTYTCEDLESKTETRKIIRIFFKKRTTFKHTTFKLEFSNTKPPIQ